MISYRGLEFEVPVLSGTGVSFDVSSPILESINTEWDESQFAIPRLPVPLGACVPTAGVVRVLDMPIKFPGTGYRVPDELDFLLPEIWQVAILDKAISGDDRYCYLTLDFGVVEAGKTARNKGCHVDGFQGARIIPKRVIDHSYVAFSALPAIAYRQAWQTAGLDPARDNYFTAFDRRAKPENEVPLFSNVLYLMDAYTVHRCAVAQGATFRVFFRMTYSVREFDRLGNTHNPLFAYAWEMQERHFGVDTI